MTNALTLARDALRIAVRYTDNVASDEDATKVDEALAAIDAELAACADAGRLAQRPHPAKDANGEDFMVCGHDMQRCSTYVECAATKCQRLAALARPAPSGLVAGRTIVSAPGAALHVERIDLTDAGRTALTSGVQALPAPVSAQGDEVDAARQAFADRVREGIADFAADNWPDRKHSLAEIESGIRAIEINAGLLAARAQQGGQT